MSTLSRRSEKRLLSGKKFSFRNRSVKRRHVAPAALMVVTGLALSAVISDVPPTFNQAYATSIEQYANDICNITRSLNDSLTDVLGTVVIQDKFERKESYLANAPKEPADGYVPSIHTQLAELTKDKEKEDQFEALSYVTSLSIDEVERKLKDGQLAEWEREVREATGQKVISGNRNLYRDTYWYQRGPSNIPSTGTYNSCTKNTGIPVSQMQMPSTLTFDENGVPENYVKCIEGKATAYYGGYMTATGSSTRPGVVAVDPRIIPYGTEMWIVSADGSIVYGFARAEDTGGFIYLNNGPICDLYMNTYADCCVWGIRGVKIYILPTSYR